MALRILVVDDDVSLVRGLRRTLAERSEVVGPPELLLDIPDIKVRIPSTSMVILDLNIGGSDDAGRSYLRKLTRTFLAYRTPVIIWSKYLFTTTLFSPRGLLRWNQRLFVEQEELRGNPDARVISDLRRQYPAIKAFVSKTITATPVPHLCDVMEQLNLLPAPDVAPSGASPMPAAPGTVVGG